MIQNCNNKIEKLKELLAKSELFPKEIKATLIETFESSKNIPEEAINKLIRILKDEESKISALERKRNKKIEEIKKKYQKT